MTTKQSILEEAAEITHGDRQATYGHPKVNFSSTAEIWTTLLRGTGTLTPGQELTAHDVGVLMIGLKLVRQAYRPKRDNLVDIAGYAHSIERLDD